MFGYPCEGKCEIIRNQRKTVMEMLGLVSLRLYLENYIYIVLVNKLLLEKYE